MNLPAIIIARGGSKRIPRKNVKPFCGRPLVEWTIVQILQAKGITKVILSTDDDEIACIGKRYNIDIFRRPSMPDNIAGSIPTKMALERLKAMGYEFEEFIAFMPTQPLRKPDDIDKAISLYYAYAKPMKTNLVSVVSVSIEHYIPVSSEIGYITKARTWHYGSSDKVFINNGLLSINNVDLYIKLIQDINEDAKETLRVRRKVMKYRPYIVPFVNEIWQLIDIDTQDMFDLCEYFFEKKGLREHYFKYLED